MMNEVQQKYYESQRTQSGNKNLANSRQSSEIFAENERMSFHDCQEML